VSISVIIPTLNEAPRIAATIRQVAESGFTDIVVVDGGSTDGTPEIAASIASDIQRSALGTIRLVITSPGRGSQMNRGAAAATGEILLFLHADTTLAPGAKASIEAAFHDPLVVGGRFDVQFDHASPWGRMISFFMNVRSRLTGIATGDQALFVRRAVFERLGGFAEIPLMEDVEFSRRLKRAGFTAALHDKVTTSFRRWEQQGPLRTILVMWALRFLYWLGVSPQRLAHFYTTVR